MPVVLAIDAGTTGVRTFAVDHTGTPRGWAYREFPQHFPKPGWVEHDPTDIWTATVATLADVARDLERDGETIAAIGITNQRETAVVWDRETGAPLHRAIVWQDRRTAPRCDELRDGGVEPLIRSRTGLVLDPYFSATKLEWLLREGGVDPGPRLAFGTVDTWLLWQLTGGPRGGEHATDPSNASRTLLFDIDALDWDDELLGVFGVPRSCLPRVSASSGRFGMTDPEAAAGLRVPVSGIAGDQQAALFGQACFEPGMTKNTYGTGSFVLMNLGPTHPEPVDGLLTTVAWSIGDTVSYAMEGAIFVTGAAIQWLRDGLGLITDAAETGALARERAGHGRRRLRSCIHRAWFSMVGSLRARRSPRRDPRHGPRAHRSRGGRGDGVADARCRRRNRSRVGAVRDRAPRRRRRQRDGPAVPAPGRRAGGSRPPTRREGDHRARRGVPRGHRRRCLAHPGGRRGRLG